MLKEFLRAGALLTILGGAKDKIDDRIVASVRGDVTTRAVNVLDTPPERPAQKPLNLIIVGDVSASFSRESRPDIMKKLEQLFDVVRAGRDFLQVYVLGIPVQPDVGRNNFGREEVEIAYATEAPIDVETLLQARVATCERYYTNRGKHSDNLWILRRINSDLEKRKGGEKRDVLMFFWDGEPNSWDDVDWRRYPNLIQLSFPERIAAYQKMIEIELLRLNAKGVEVYFVTPPGATLPNHAKSIASGMFSSDGDPEIFTDFIDSLRPRKPQVQPRRARIEQGYVSRDVLSQFQIAQTHDLSIVILSVAAALSLAGLGFALRKQKKTQNDAGTKIQNLVHGAYEEGFEAGRQSAHEATFIALEFRADSEAELRRAAEKQVGLLTEQLRLQMAIRPRRPPREMPFADLAVESLPPPLDPPAPHLTPPHIAPSQRNSPAAPLPQPVSAPDPPPEPDPPEPESASPEPENLYDGVISELRDVIQALEQGRALQSTPFLDRLGSQEVSFNKVEEAEMQALLIRLLQVCENRGYALYFFGPDDYQSFFQLMEGIYEAPIDRGKSFRSTMNPRLLQIELAKKHDGKSQKLRRFLSHFLLVNGDRFFAASKGESFISIEPTCFLRCAIRDSKRESLLVIEWDTDQLKVFDIPENEKEQFFSQDHDGYKPEICGNLCGVIKKILEKISFPV